MPSAFLPRAVQARRRSADRRGKDDRRRRVHRPAAADRSVQVRLPPDAPVRRGNIAMRDGCCRARVGRRAGHKRPRASNSNRRSSAGSSRIKPAVGPAEWLLGASTVPAPSTRPSLVMVMTRCRGPSMARLFHSACSVSGESARASGLVGRAVPLHPNHDHGPLNRPGETRITTPARRASHKAAPQENRRICLAPIGRRS